MLYTIRGLEDGAVGVDVRVRVVFKEEPRKVKTKDGLEHVIVDVYVGDQTGMISISLWDDKSNGIEVGNILDVDKGYVNRFKGRLKLNISKYGTLEKVEDPDFPNVERILESQKHRRQRRRVPLGK